MKVLSLFVVSVVVCFTEGYIVDVSSSKGIVGATHHHPEAQDLVKTLYRRDAAADLKKAKRNCRRCLNGIYCKEMKRCKICRKMCNEAGIPMPEEDASNATSTPSSLMSTAPSTLVEMTEQLLADEPVELQERFGSEPEELQKLGEPEPKELQEPLVGEPEENFVKNQKDLEPETLKDQTMVTSGMRDNKSLRLDPEFYTVGSFRSGPVKDLMERLLNVNEDQSGRIRRLIVIAQTKATYKDEQAVILDSAHAFDGHVPIIVSVTKGHPRQLAFEDDGKLSVTRDQLETIIEQVMKELKDAPEALPETTAPKAANEKTEEETGKRQGDFKHFDEDDNGGNGGEPAFTTSTLHPFFVKERIAAPLSSENQVKESEDFGNVQSNEVGVPDSIPKMADEAIPKQSFQRIPQARIPGGSQNPEVGTPEETSGAHENLEKSIMDVVENSLKDLGNVKLEEANPEDMMRRMEAPLEQMNERPMERMETMDRIEQEPMEKGEFKEMMEQRPVGPMEMMEQQPSGPMEMMEQRPVGPMEVMEQRPVGPMEIMGERPIGPMEVMDQRPAGPMEVMEQRPAGPMEVMEQKPVGPMEVMEQRPAGSMEVMKQRPVGPMEMIEQRPVEPMEGAGQVPMEPFEIADQRPVEQRFREAEEKPELQPDGTNKTRAQIDAEFKKEIRKIVDTHGKIHTKDLPNEFPYNATNLMARNPDAEDSEEFKKFGELVPRGNKPGNWFFVGKNIKLPLSLVTDESGRVGLTVDMDRMCGCKNQNCTKSHMEEMIRERRSLEPDFVNSIEHVFDSKKDEDEDELVKLNEEYQFRQLEEKLEDKLDKLNKDVEKYNDENETLLNKGTLALFKNVEKAKDVEKAISLVNTVLSWMKNLTIHHAAN